MRSCIDNGGVDSADLFNYLRKKLSAFCTGCYDITEKVSRDAELIGHIIRPVTVLCIEHLSGGSNSVFCLFYACEEILQKVGNKEHILCVVKGMRSLSDLLIQLIDGVEIEELCSGYLIKLFHNTLCRSFITVAVRVFKKLSVLIKKAVVNAPCVDCHRLYVFII